MRIQFGLKSLLAINAVACVCAAIYVFLAPRELPVTEVSCTQPWSDVTNHSETVVVFVDCDANGWTVRYGDLYEQYCRWYRWTYARNVILVETTPGHGETWDVLQRTWRERGVSTGAYKTWGGAGQMLWIKHGKILDTAFLPEFKDLASLKQRTSNNFW